MVPADLSVATTIPVQCTEVAPVLAPLAFLKDDTRGTHKAI